MSSNNSINSSTFTEVELSLIAMGLYLLISPIHGVSKITQPLLKMLNIKSPTSLLLFSGLLFGVIYYFSIKLVLGPLYNKIRKSGFKVGGQNKEQCEPVFLGPERGYVNIMQYNDANGNCEINMDELQAVCSGDMFQTCLQHIADQPTSESR